MSDMDSIRTDALAAYGEQAAQALPAHGKTSGKREARRIRRALRAVLALGHDTEGGAWYADNAWLAREAASQAIAAFRHAGRLRASGHISAVTALAMRLWDAGDLTEARLGAFLTGARRVDRLSETEVCLFGAGLRAALLRRLAEELDETESGRCFTALRAVCSLDMGELLERSDPVDAVLRRDKIYPRMDEQSRADYRRRVRVLAKKRGEAPVLVASAAVNDGLHEALFPHKERSGRLYIALYAALTLLLALAAGLWDGRMAVAALLLLPLSELVRSVSNAVLLRLVPPRRLFRLALNEGVGTDGRTVCAIFALLTDKADGAYFARRLEQFRLANRDGGENLLFALVADLPESRQSPPPGGTEALTAAAGAIDALNARYGGGFFLLTRENVFSRRDKLWRPYERKRGAMEALARLVCGKVSALRCAAGERSELHASYILCLDADTCLTPGSARALIGAALHPLNRPVIEARRVVRGHGLLHPCMTTELDCAMATDFARLHIGQGGTEPYGLLRPELFFDLFGRGGFAGKGLIDARAYLACMENRIPDEQVLSHDTIEGAYLRGGYMGDVEFTDTAPVNAAGWFRRLERWTRGDWQNVTFLFAEGLTPVDRFRIFDDLRRSLVSAASLAALILGLWRADMRLAAALALLSLAADCLIESFNRLFLRRSDAHARLRSAVLRGVGGALARLMSRLVLLPWDACCRLLAALTALWRMTVSRRRRLQWVPAGQAVHGGKPSAALLLSMAMGAVLLLLCPGSLGKAAGLIWLAVPLFTTASGWERKPHAELTESDRALLKREALAVWDYFSTLCQPSDGFLPPDNFQTQPPKGAARRASPTNLGLGLIVCLAALDMELCPPEKALTLIERMLTTIEALPKWRGHLYNWYDTATRSPLQPVYVSAVDSGNFCACLLCLANGLLEYDRPGLAARARALCDATELAALYDGKKRLFHIGLDPVRERSSEAHYDLMASEARLTSFLAVARGDVPLRHWAALGRAQLSLDGWRGLASWSGSVFEYLMPELFLPLCRGSLFWETARFCLYAQRRHARRHNAPWGNSESAFFAVDASLDWRYKAHGTGALALDRGMDADLVVSPYSSFLALCVHPRAALKNLRWLKSLGMWGRFGFYEALDLTPGRARDGGSPVLCFMAHHLGMSMAAIDNCLCAGTMRRRFMAEPCCAAFSGLLRERVPLGGRVLRRGAPTMPRPETVRQPIPAFSLSADAPDMAAPRFFPLSNGVYSLLAGEDGSCRAVSSGVLLYRPDRFRLCADGHALTPAGADGHAHSWRYAAGVLRFDGTWGDRVMSTTLAAAASECGELRLISAWPGAVVELRLEPVLARLTDWEAHPAFWTLGLECLARDGLVLVRRLARGSLPELWLCLGATVPLRVTEGLGWQMLGAITVQTALPEGGCLALAIALGADRDETAAAARRILAGGTADMAGTMAALLGLGEAGLADCFRLCTALARPRVAANELATRKALWRGGISGDLPLVYCDAQAHPDEARALIRRHALLTACGLSFDLALDTGEDGEYLHPRAQALRRYLDHYGLTPFENARGGTHLASGAALRASAISAPEPRRPMPLALPTLPERGHDAPAVRTLASGAVCFDTPPLPPRAWQNVLSNGRFGFIATDGGTGHIWLENAREAQITPWENDPLAVRGPETLELVTPGGRRSLFADGLSGCRVSFGFGWARWERAGTSVTAFIPGAYAARLLIIEGGDGGDILWHLRLRMAAESADAPFTMTAQKGGVLRAYNPRSPRMGIFRALCSHKPTATGLDETAFLRGEADDGDGKRPCFTLRVPGGGVHVIACGFEDESTLAALAEPERAARELIKTRDGWKNRLRRLHIRTPYPELDAMMNGWAAYQTLCGRILGRSSIYQSGGAYGFRDQLQDAVNLLPLTTAPARRQILLCCERQFTEGDVLHWWHEGGDAPRGVRTRCSDDLLWLCWALCEYTEKTGDLALCAVLRPWLAAPPLADGEDERYFQPAISEERAGVLEHARRALALVRRRGTGPHGLLKMGSGDWNDGMDRVGGESAWLTMFCAHTAARFASLLMRLGEPDAEDTAAFARSCTAAAGRAWDGGWYLRGWWESGAPLGAAGARECELDSIVQSWAAFCPGLPPERVRKALRTAYERLFDEAHGIVRLFTPPFTGEGSDPGYIRACGPGFRENGGQYTHGAVWLGMALLRAGLREEGEKLLLALLPQRHDGAIWQAEPYVIAADVSANRDHYGTANWSWYTGSAGWFFHAVLESLLGLRLENGRLRVEAPAFDYEARLGTRNIRVKNGKATVT